jgi:hypothetical protein
MNTPDPDARLIMDVLLASPNRDEPGTLLAAAKAYEAIRSARDRGSIPPLDEPRNRQALDAAVRLLGPTAGHRWLGCPSLARLRSGVATQVLRRTFHA